MWEFSNLAISSLQEGNGEKCHCALFLYHNDYFFVFKYNNGFSLSETQEVKLRMYIIF